MFCVVHGDGSPEGAVVVTEKFSPLLAMPLTVTTTFPDVAPEGTLATIRVAVQLVTEADEPLKRTVLVPCDEPKFDPLMVTEVPVGPDVGDRLVNAGVGGA